MTKDEINSLIWEKLPWLAVKLHSVGNHTVLDNAEFMSAYRQIISEGECLLSLRDMFNIYSYVCQARHMPGDMAEVGVYQGRGAKLISLFKADARLHLFDTFEGMPATNLAKDTYHQLGDFKQTSLQKVQEYLKGFDRVEFHPGFFPNTALQTPVTNIQFSFVHLDADIFQSTLDGLNFFYPRLVAGGFLLTHDYSSRTCPGVKPAFESFLRDTGVAPIPLWDSHCLIIKT